MKSAWQAIQEEFLRTIISGIIALVLASVFPGTLDFVSGMMSIYGPIRITPVQVAAFVMAVTWAGYVTKEFMPELPQKPKEIRLTINWRMSKTHQRTEFADLPCTEEQLRKFAEQYLSSGSLSTRAMTGQDGIFGGSEWPKFRDEAVRCGWLRWKQPGTPTLGIERTAKGRAVMRGLMRNEPT